MSLSGLTMYKTDVYSIEHYKITVKVFELYGFSKILNVCFESLRVAFPDACIATRTVVQYIKTKWG